MEADVSSLDFEFSTEVVCLWPWEYHYYEPPGCLNHTDMYHCNPLNRCNSCLSRVSQATWILPASPPRPTSTCCDLDRTTIKYEVTNYHVNENEDIDVDVDVQEHHDLPINAKIKTIQSDHSQRLTNAPLISTTGNCRVYPNENQTCFICSENTDKLLSVIKWIQDGDWSTNCLTDFHIISSSTTTESDTDPDQVLSTESNHRLETMSSSDNFEQDRNQELDHGDGTENIYDRSFAGSWNSESGESYASPDLDHIHEVEHLHNTGILLSSWKPYLQSSQTFFQDNPVFERRSKASLGEVQNLHEGQQFIRSQKVSPRFEGNSELFSAAHSGRTVHVQDEYSACEEQVLQNMPSSSLYPVDLNLVTRIGWQNQNPDEVPFHVVEHLAVGSKCSSQSSSSSPRYSYSHWSVQPCQDIPASILTDSKEVTSRGRTFKEHTEISDPDHSYSSRDRHQPAFANVTEKRECSAYEVNETIDENCSANVVPEASSLSKVCKTPNCEHTVFHVLPPISSMEIDAYSIPFADKDSEHFGDLKANDIDIGLQGDSDLSSLQQQQYEINADYPLFYASNKLYSEGNLYIESHHEDIECRNILHLSSTDYADSLEIQPHITELFHSTTIYTTEFHEISPATKLIINPGEECEKIGETHFDLKPKQETLICEVNSSNLMQSSNGILQHKEVGSCAQNEKAVVATNAWESEWDSIRYSFKEDKTVRQGEETDANESTLRKSNYPNNLVFDASPRVAQCPSPTLCSASNNLKHAITAEKRCVSSQCQTKNKRSNRKKSEKQKRNFGIKNAKSINKVIVETQPTTVALKSAEESTTKIRSLMNLRVTQGSPTTVDPSSVQKLQDNQKLKQKSEITHIKLTPHSNSNVPQVQGAVKPGMEAARLTRLKALHSCRLNLRFASNSILGYDTSNETKTSDSDSNDESYEHHVLYPQRVFTEACNVVSNFGTKDEEEKRIKPMRDNLPAPYPVNRKVRRIKRSRLMVSERGLTNSKQDCGTQTSIV